MQFFMSSFAGRDTLPGACAPPHKGRGRGPKPAQSAVRMGGAGVKRSGTESPGRGSLPAKARAQKRA